MSVTLNYLEQKQGGPHRDALMSEAMMAARQNPVREKSSAPLNAESLRTFASHIHPYINETCTSDNNIDAVEHDRHSEIINTINPGVKTNFRDSNKTFTTDMSVNEVVYYKRDRASSGSASAKVALNYRLGKSLLTLADSYTNLFEPAKTLTGQTVIDNAENDIDAASETVRNWSNTFNVGFGRAYNRFGFDAGFSRQDYEQWPSDGDSVSETYFFNPYLKASNKSRILGTYSFERKKYPHEDNGDDQNTDKFGLGITSAISPKTTIVINSEQKRVDNRIGDDTVNTTLSTNIGYKINSRADLSLSYTYKIDDVPKSKSDNVKTNSLSFSGNNRFAFNPKFRLHYGVSASHKGWYKLTGSPDTQLDRTYKLNLSLDYNFTKWLDFSLGWTRTIFNSNIATDYDKDVVVFKTAAKF
jgi:hypothetical protein